MSESISLKQCSRKDKCVNLSGSFLPASLDYFSTDTRTSDGWYSQCRVCSYESKKRSAEKHKEQYREVRLERYKTNPQVRAAIKATNDDWRKRNPERVSEMDKRRYALERGAKGSHTVEDIQVLRVGQNNRCWWCACELDKFEVDHRVPISKGGSDNPENLCLTCVRCNRSKGAKLPQEWIGRLL